MLVHPWGSNADIGCELYDSPLPECCSYVKRGSFLRVL